MDQKTIPGPRHPSVQSGEQALRRKLEIPHDARRILIFAETSHWDPDWIYTSEEYYQRYVQRNLDLAVQELLNDPRRVYSVECVFFLRMYWEARPEQQENVRLLVNQGRLRMTSSGVTTADTLIPTPEALLRDFLLGQEWMRENGLLPEPTVAYFPDSFGCSHALPSLLNAAGFDRTAITRIDGMYFFGSEAEPKSRFPWRGSSAERLAKEHGSLDFIWKDGSGGEALAHWNAFTYGQGDLLAHFGISRVYIFPSAVPLRIPAYIAHNIERFAAQLAPLSPTPYMFCPIGFDFVPPIPDLVSLLDRYNQDRYEQTGIWAVNAGIDDYLEFVNYYREKLPVVAVDPNPYWTGFYSSRPSLKRACRDLSSALQQAETLALLSANAVARGAALRELSGPWWKAVSSNHHDFVTGTATDHVVDEEQTPWMQSGLEKVTEVIKRLEPAVTAPGGPLSVRVVGERSFDGSGANEQQPRWSEHDGLIQVDTPYYTLELSANLGGCITRAWDPATGETLLEGPSGDLTAYADWGGLWRMGNEFPGGMLRLMDRASRHKSPLGVNPLDGKLEVSATLRLDGRDFIRRWIFRCDSPIIGIEVEGMAADNRTVTLGFATGLHAKNLTMDEPGGVIERPWSRRYKPTFWPAQSFAHVTDGGRGVALLPGMMSAVALRAEGKTAGMLELISHRNANQERFWGIVPFTGMPVKGHERSPHTARYGLLLTRAGDWRDNRLLAAGQSPEFAGLARQVVTVEPSEVQVAAVKPASRGEGFIVRLYAPGMQGQTVRLAFPRHIIRAAQLCDARERDLKPLDLDRGQVCLQMPGAFASVRVIP